MESLTRVPTVLAAQNKLLDSDNVHISKKQTNRTRNMQKCDKKKKKKQKKEEKKEKKEKRKKG